MTFVKKEYESNNAMDITYSRKGLIVFHKTTYFQWNDSSPGEFDYEAKCYGRRYVLIELLFYRPVIFRTFRIQLSD